MKKLQHQLIRLGNREPDLQEDIAPVLHVLHRIAKQRPKQLWADIKGRFDDIKTVLDKKEIRELCNKTDSDLSSVLGHLNKAMKNDDVQETKKITETDTFRKCVQELNKINLEGGNDRTQYMANQLEDIRRRCDVLDLQ